MREILFHEYPGYLKTDMLPFEIPVMYSNDSYYNYISKNRNQYRKQINKNKLNYSQFAAKPLSYNSFVRDNKTRELSLINPLSYMSVLHYIKSNENIILSSFQNNSYSLRYPTKRIEQYIYKGKIRTKLYSISKVDRVEKKNGTHYAIKKFKRSYEFENSQHFLDLQYEYRFFTKLDIKGCFDSIYTHSYKWIISDEIDISKKIGNSENYLGKLDVLLRSMNAQKTNGILVGAEFFRLAAEILLSHIDSKIKKELKDKKVIVRRFIDDYYVFAETEEDLIFTENVIETCLKKYMLRLNERKRRTHSDYFVLNEWYTETNQILNQLDMYNLNSVNTQKNIMSIITKHKEQRSTVTTYIISVLINRQQDGVSQLKRICKHKKEMKINDKVFQNDILGYMNITEEEFMVKFSDYIMVDGTEKYLRRNFIDICLVNSNFEKRIFSYLTKIFFYIKLAPKYVNYLKLVHLINDYILVAKYAEKNGILNAITNALNKNFDFNHLNTYKVECSNMFLIFEILEIKIDEKIIRKVMEENNPLFHAVVYRYMCNSEGYDELCEEVEKKVEENINSLPVKKMYMKDNIWYYILFNNAPKFKTNEKFIEIRNSECTNDQLLKSYFSEGFGFMNYDKITDNEALEILNKNIYFKSLVNINY